MVLEVRMSVVGVEESRVGVTLAAYASVEKWDGGVRCDIASRLGSSAGDIVGVVGRQREHSSSLAAVACVGSEEHTAFLFRVRPRPRSC